MRDVLAAVPGAVRGGAPERFDSAVAAMLGRAQSISLASLMRNTCAVMLAVKRLRPGGVVILPRYSCPSFIHGIQAAGIAHRYCDIDASTLAVAPELVDRCGTDGACALLVPNLFGLSADMHALAEFCRRRDLLMIDGADYTFGGTFAGSALGSFGDFAILNFQEGKALPIGGGMALSKVPGALPEADPAGFGSSPVMFLRSLAFSILIRPVCYGLFSRLLAATGFAKKKLSMEDTIRRTTSEFDYQATEGSLLRSIAPFQSSLGLVLLRSIESEFTARETNARLLESALQGIGGCVLIPRHPGLDRCHYIRYPVLVDGGRRDALCRKLIEGGFEASAMYVEHGMNIDPGAFPGAARICDELITLPCHGFLENSEIERMTTIVRTTLSSSHVS